jgi:hypothetical protein
MVVSGQKEGGPDTLVWPDKSVWPTQNVYTHHSPTQPLLLSYNEVTWVHSYPV